MQLHRNIILRERILGHLLGGLSAQDRSKCCPVLYVLAFKCGRRTFAAPLMHTRALGFAPRYVALARVAGTPCVAETATAWTVQTVSSVIAPRGGSAAGTTKSAKVRPCLHAVSSTLVNIIGAPPLSVQT